MEDISYESFSGETHTGEAFSFHTFSDCVFSNQTYTDCDFSSAVFTSCTFETCTFISCRMPECLIDGCSFTDSKLMGVTLEGARIRKSIFLRVNFSYSDLSSMRLQDVEITSSSLEETGFTDVTHKRVRIHNSNLCCAVLTGTSLRDLSLTGSSLDGIFLSDSMKEVRGAELDISQAVDIVKLLGVTVK